MGFTKNITLTLGALLCSTMVVSCNRDRDIRATDSVATPTAPAAPIAADVNTGDYNAAPVTVDNSNEPRAMRRSTLGTSNDFDSSTLGTSGGATTDSESPTLATVPSEPAPAPAKQTKQRKHITSDAQGMNTERHNTGKYKFRDPVQTENSMDAIARSNTIVSDYTVIKFDEGSASLSTTAMTKLDELVSQARSRGQIDQIRLAVWSDRVFSNNKNALSSSDKKLAAQRADALRDYLKTTSGISSVAVFNMATRSNWLARTINTNDAELKSVFGKKGGVPVGHDEFRIFKENGEPQSAVVTVLMRSTTTDEPNNLPRSY